jgi:peptide chain release factor subunit 1
VVLSTKPLDVVVEDLKTFESLDEPVISMYWNVPADRGELKGAVAVLKDLVKEVRARAASSGLSHAARTSLSADANRMLDLQDLVPNLQGRTLAFFRCGARGLEEAIDLPGGLPDRVEVDARPFIRPLVAVLTESHRFAVVIVDREHGLLFDFYLGVLEAREDKEGRVLRSPNYAPGDKEYSTHRKAEELAKRHYRETARALNEMVHQDNIELVVVGGHEDTIPAFCQELPADLRQKVVGTFTVDPHTMTPASARDAAQRAVDEYERHHEEQLVEQTMERVAAGGLGAVGLDWCLLATAEKAIDLLLVDADAHVEGRICDRCGWLGLEGDECPIDGTPTRATPDVIDDMAAQVLDSSGRVEHVNVETPLRRHLVAALLRFPVPHPEPAPA